VEVALKRCGLGDAIAGKKNRPRMNANERKFLGLLEKPTREATAYRMERRLVQPIKI
jgi:hypothetical protein